MALTNRYRSATGAGTVAALILVLIFGSPWYVDWARDNTDPNTAGGWFLRLLSWPAWRFDSDDSVQNVIAADLRAILVVVLTALFLYLLPGSQLAAPAANRPPSLSPLPPTSPAVRTVVEKEWKFRRG
jgi:hypothetical protein